MYDSLFKQIALPDRPSDLVWEQFHENAKANDQYGIALSNEAIASTVENLSETLPYHYLTKTPLPTKNVAIKKKFKTIIQNRITTQNIKPTHITLQELRTILYFAYGETRDNKNTVYPRPFRTVPSGGALYPLELYFFSNGFITGLPAGVYHYSPTQNCVALLQKGDLTKEIANALISFQNQLAYDTTLIIFITAIFNRSIFKYRDKGYRFVLLEAGHVAQNINLTATALNLGVINIGGYNDRLMDKFLGLDGLNHSTIYLNGIGKKEK